MWNPFRRKKRNIQDKNYGMEDIREEFGLIFSCPPQQLATRKCVCIDCEKKGVCPTEKLVALANNCENNWVKACSVLKGNDEKTVFNAIFAEYYESLSRRSE